MICRHLILLGLGSLLLLAGVAPAAPAVRGHWLGLDQIRADNNSTRCLAVWQLPATQTLVAQTLAKISRLPAADANPAASALLRPLLDDLIAAETCFELYTPTNSSLATRHSSLLLALRLAPDRARLWQTNLPAAFPHVTFSRAGTWTLVALGNGANDLLPAFAAQLPGAPAQTNFWLTADLSQLPSANSHLPTPISHLHLSLTGEAGELRTRATLDFAQPLNLTLTPWLIPTNLLCAGITSFTAARGLAPWLAGWPVWQKLQLTPAPDQAYLWSIAGVPFQTYLAAPLPNATNQLTRLAARAVAEANPWLAAHAEGNFQTQAHPPGLVWNNAMFINPYLVPARAHQQEYLFGGLYAQGSGDPDPAFAAVLRSVLQTPELVYYHTEQADVRVEDYLFITQLFRMVFHQPQLPVDAAGTDWLKKIEPLLGGNTTFLTRTGPAQLTFSRVSTLGLTALELHFLADWLESPTFPRGLHTFPKAE